MKETVKQGDANCQHTFSRQDKVVVQVLKRVCTRCGHEDLVSDNENVDAVLARKLLNR